MLNQLTKALVGRALQAEMAEYLAISVTNITGNPRNGKSYKYIQWLFDELAIDILCDREGRYKPQLIAEHQTRWTGFYDKIILL